MEKRSRASFTTQSLVLTRRSFVNMSRDLGYYWLRLAVYIVIAVGLGTIYYDVGFSYTSIQVNHEKHISTCIELIVSNCLIIYMVKIVKRLHAHVCGNIHHFYGHWWILLFCGRTQGTIHLVCIFTFSSSHDVLMMYARYFNERN